MNVLGIDPGLTGALAWLTPDGQLLEVSDMPTLDGEVSAALLANDDEITRSRVAVAVLEWPGLMPKNGAKSARSMGMSLATMTAVFAVRGIPCHRVTPAHWKNQMGLNAAGATDAVKKEAARQLAIRLWPEHVESFKRKKDAGRAEAALLAYWWLTKGARAVDGAA